MSTALVFVYGTLRAGQSNHGLLRTAQSLGPASITGGYVMVSLGGFPGVVHAPGYGPRRIVGEVYRVDAPTLTALDRLEGHPRWYVRQMRALDVGAPVTMAWVYFFPIDDARGRPMIVGGDWVRR